MKSDFALHEDDRFNRMPGIDVRYAFVCSRCGRGHGERIVERRLPRMAHGYQEKEIKRRSCLRWLHCIKMNKKAEVADEEWRIVTQDRRQWKNVVHNRVSTTSNKIILYNRPILLIRQRLTT